MWFLSTRKWDLTSSCSHLSAGRHNTSPLLEMILKDPCWIGLIRTCSEGARKWGTRTKKSLIIARDRFRCSHHWFVGVVVGFSAAEDVCPVKPCRAQFAREYSFRFSSLDVLGATWYCLELVRILFTYSVQLSWNFLNF